MKKESSFRLYSARTMESWETSGAVRRPAGARRAETQSLRPSFSPRGLLLAMVFCSTQCLAQAFVAGSAFAADSTPSLGELEPAGSTHAASESFALSSPGYRSPQVEPSLLIGMIEHDAYAATTHAKTAAVHPAYKNGYEPVDFYAAMDRALATVIRRPSSLDSSDGLAAFFKMPPRYAFLSRTDLRSFVRTPIYQVNSGYPVFLSGTPSVADAGMSIDQRDIQFKPLAEIHLGTYNLPLVLYAPENAAAH